MTDTTTKGRPRLVYSLTAEHQIAIADYYFTKRKITNLRQLAKALCLSVQGASNVSLRVLAQWAEEGRIIINLNFPQT